MSFEDAKREALKLSFDEREDLARTLYASLDEEDPEPESVLPPEVRRRYQAYREGKTKSLSLEELLAGLV
ncbi:MAG TPA: addiction module protein [Thermoanaerobaculia bacterium]|nr:addiction module protein [Thermoanaerobaculia bacterium]